MKDISNTSLFNSYMRWVRFDFNPLPQLIASSIDGQQILKQGPEIVSQIGEYLKDMYPTLIENEDFYTAWLVMAYWIEKKYDLGGPSPLKDFKKWILWAAQYEKPYIPLGITPTENIKSNKIAIWA